MKYESHRDKKETPKEPRQNFSLSQTLGERLQDQPIVVQNEQQDCKESDNIQNEENTQKIIHNKPIPKDSKTAIVSFRYQGSPPDVTETVIYKVLQQYIKKNKLVQQPRIFKHKFYVDFEQVPDLVLLKEKFQDFFPKTQVFSHYDVPNKQDLNTVYLGRILGIDINLLKDACRELLDDQPVSVRIPQKDGKPKQFGYLEFTNREAARFAVTKFDGLNIGLTDGIRAVLLIED
ncbi:RNA recognition motif-containing protein [Spironucleus salmonicida]|uniref:RNA recognition motif-containing protein n=1 Tax=Spironucleus salmonicida TaxID=348837 RepID=V6LH09_9EUKA|nr:RNA recognition motif-containing protein [Spironucleus salmonicida]|eukprot:EST42996.1 hypothetical protein SS50377_17297 [Spironucleus salmonicida]